SSLLRLGARGARRRGWNAMVEPTGGREPDGPDPVMVSMARYSGYGLQLAGSVGLFMAGGWWVDGKLGTTPLLTILGALGGGTAGFYSLYSHLVKKRDQVVEPDRKAR